MIRTICLALTLLAAAAGASGAQPDANELLTALATYGRSETLLVGKLTSARPGPTGMSMPPVHTARLTVEVQRVLRGEGEAGKTMTFAYSSRQQRPPQFPVGELCVIAGERERRAAGNLDMRVTHVGTGDDAVKLAELAATIPLGWRVEKGKLTCPWSTLKDYHWPEQHVEDVARCATTDRPALPAGPIEFKVEPIIDPAKQIKWTNPDGDGEFRITVTNPTDKPLIVPALLSNDKGICWDQSLLITCRDSTYTLPGAAAPAGPFKSTTLKPGESVSTVVNVLPLDGPPWPRGGSRLSFLFSLGEHGQTHSLYYMTKHHGVLRGKMQIVGE